MTFVQNFKKTEQTNFNNGNGSLRTDGLIYITISILIKEAKFDFCACHIKRQVFINVVWILFYEVK
jgi:hypothetical protein